MENEIVAVAIAILAAAVLAAFARWIRRPAPIERPTAHDRILGPVEHTGATEEWHPVEELTPSGDPLARDLSDMELEPAHTYEEVAAALPVRLDWAPPTWSQEWELAGKRAAEAGADTVPLPALEQAA
jgi:hypothetical protein